MYTDTYIYIQIHTCRYMYTDIDTCIQIQIQIKIKIKMLASKKTPVRKSQPAEKNRVRTVRTWENFSGKILYIVRYNQPPSFISSGRSQPLFPDEDADVYTLYEEHGYQSVHSATDLNEYTPTKVSPFSSDIIIRTSPL